MSRGPVSAGRQTRPPAEAVPVGGAGTGTTAGTTAGTGQRIGLGVALGCAGLTVLLQIGYPLLHGPALTAATVSAVLSFAAASVSHAAARFGPRGLLTAAAAAALALLAEAVGVHTGVPFGGYRYAASLGPQLAGVPLVVPLAWTMMAYPSLLLARRLAEWWPGRPAGRRLAVALAGGWTLAAWDLFLDPQLVAAGHWIWSAPDPHLPGVPGVPLSNAGGWLVVGVLLIAVLDRLLPRSPGAAESHGRGPLHRPFDAVPAGLLAWTWLGSTLANVAFFHRPWVGLYGGVALGLTVGPYLWAVRRAAR